MNRRSSRTRNKRRRLIDPDQQEFGIIWQELHPEFRLHAGDVFLFNNRICRVVRVNESEAVVIMNRPIRRFKTRFDKPVRFQPPPARFYISARSEVTVLNRKTS